MFSNVRFRYCGNLTFARGLVIIASDSVSDFRSSVVQWNPDAKPLPLVETRGELVTSIMRQEREYSVLTLTEMYPFQEQFLHVHIAFSQPSSSDDMAG